MTDSERGKLERRVLVLTLTNKDAALTQSLLERAGLCGVCCSSLEQVCAELEAGAGAVLLAEEAIATCQNDCLAKWLAAQPPWSDLPVLILAHSGANSEAVMRAMELLGNVTVLERPIRVAALVSSVRTALRARGRQYQMRNQLIERERSMEGLAFLAAIIAASDDAIISKTLQGIILTWNGAAKRLFGYSAKEAIGKSITLIIPPEKQEEERSILERLGRGERIEPFDTVRVANDGRRIDIALTVSPIWSADGKIIGASKIARDITQRKRTEAALLQADRRKDEFLAILGHELRNPLAPIRNSLHILRMNRRNDSATDHVGEMMERQVNHMVRLVDDLLEVSRITRGKIELRKEQIEVAAVVRSAVETSGPLIEELGHQLAVTIPTEPLFLEADPVRLTQVLANLLNNAAKYTATGGQIWLSVRREAQELVISVRDTGMGISQEMLSRVFDMFTQFDQLDDRGKGGLGIGLTLVKSLVELHGGRVSAHSDGPGKGSEFIVRLPLVTVHRPIDVQRPKELTSPPLASPRILVVDDNRDSADSMGMLLKMLGADVRVAYDGPEAIEAITTHKPLAVLLDIGMPGMDGHEVARWVRQQPGAQDMTLIALTGWGQMEDRLRTQTAGFDYHLVKPADVTALKTLLASIESRMGNQGMARQP
ncbi:MAG TPA: ATP-binding protein [Phycisphaerae bacterium]|nr:ATP-binding protein [Phycisphaerae bacterium]